MCYNFSVGGFMKEEILIKIREELENEKMKQDENINKNKRIKDNFKNNS